MKKPILVILFFIGFIFSQIVVEVDGYKVTKEELDTLFHVFWKRITHLSSAKPTQEDKRIFLIDYVADLLILKEAKKMGIEVSEKEINDFIRKYVGRKIKEKSVINAVKAEILVEKLVDKLMKEQELNPSEDILRAYYEFYKREFYRPSSVKLLGIYVKSKKEAERISQILKQGEVPSTEDVKVSKPLWYSIPTLPKYIRRNFRTLSVGEVSKPIKINDGYLVFKILDKKPAGFIPFERAKSLVKKMYLKEKRKEVFKKWLSEVLKKYKVRFYWENL